MPQKHDLGLQDCLEEHTVNHSSPTLPIYYWCHCLSAIHGIGSWDFRCRAFQDHGSGSLQCKCCILFYTSY